MVRQGVWQGEVFSGFSTEKVNRARTQKGFFFFPRCCWWKLIERSYDYTCVLGKRLPRHQVLFDGLCCVFIFSSQTTTKPGGYTEQRRDLCLTWWKLPVDRHRRARIRCCVLETARFHYYSVYLQLSALLHTLSLTHTHFSLIRKGE